MDLDALKVAEELGKEIHFLEKIEEQIEALNGISPTAHREAETAKAHRG